MEKIWGSEELCYACAKFKTFLRLQGTESAVRDTTVCAGDTKCLY